MPTTHQPLATTLPRDMVSGLVVFLVALPLCLGVALASSAPLISGIIAGVVGGILVGVLSGSHTSVSGPAAGLTAIVAAQLTILGSFEALLLAIGLAGILQMIMGVARLGFLSAFFPSSVIKGLLAAIGVILILKQIPHLFGHDKDPEGQISFIQPDDQNTFTEIAGLLNDIHPSASVIGIISIVVLVLWDQIKWLKKTPVPSALIVVFLGIGLGELLGGWGGRWVIEASHRVNVPIANSVSEFLGFLRMADFSMLNQSAIYVAAFTLAAVASLETLLNLEAVDKIDPKQRTSPASRELFAQGVGNLTCGLIGGIPVTSVIIRSSVNINSGAQTKLAAIVHGILLLVCVAFLPQYLNRIPLSCLAAILLVTGVKLASPALIRSMWKQGPYQFVPFIVTVIAIVLTDLLIGVMIGLAISTAFVLRSNMRRPLRRIVEKHLGSELIRIILANQVSFLNRGALDKAINEIPRDGRVIFDAQNTDYIDPDVLSLISDFQEFTAPARNITVSLLGFRSKYQLTDHTQFVDYSTRELQDALTPQQVLQLLKDGHDRFVSGQLLTRDFERQVQATAHGQHPLAVVLSCIDSRTPAELIFDTGFGDIFTTRIAGNISSRKVLGSIEYACAVAGAKLILVFGHTQCGAIGAAVKLMGVDDISKVTGCQHITDVLDDIQLSVDPVERQRYDVMTAEEQEKFVNASARRNVIRVVDQLTHDSVTLAGLLKAGKIAVVGAMYDVATGRIEFLAETASREAQPGNLV